MATSTVLRVPRTDSEGDHLLLHITPTGSRSLDLKLIGTEHEHLYHGSIKETSVKTLQASNYSGDLIEWKALLNHVLLHQDANTRKDALNEDALRGLELVAAISKETLTLTLRKNIRGITQRLGSIPLAQDDEREEVSVFAWVDTAVATSDSLRTEVATLHASFGEQQAQVEKLRSQLEEVVEAKKQHEEELVAKFAMILNAKKLKIRDQQRLLKGAKVDAEVAGEVGRANGRSGKGNGVSRKGKRKAEVVQEDDEDDEPSMDSEDEGMAVQQDTPEETEVEDEEISEDEGFAPTTQPPQRGGMGGRNLRSASPVGPVADGNADDDPAAASPPTKQRGSRGLPSRTAAPATKPDDDDDDETDDEL